MATILDLGVLGQGGEILHPMQRNKWRVDFLSLGAGADEALTIQAVTMDRPKVEFEEIQLDRYNSRAYVAGKYTFQPINIVFESDIGGRAAELIQFQHRKQQEIIGFGPGPRLPASPAGQFYKFTTRAAMLDGDLGELEVWAIEGCFFQNIDWGDLDYSTGEAVKITATIRFDHARQLITGLHRNARGTGNQHLT